VVRTVTPGAGPQQRLRHLRRARQDLLAVVQADQRATVPELHRQRPQRALDGRSEHPDRRRGDLGDLGGIGDRLELDPPHAVRPPLGLIGGELGGEPGLARATDAGQRHQPPPAQQGRHRGQLGPPPDEAGEVHRQRVPDRAGGCGCVRHGPQSAGIGHAPAANSATRPMFRPGRTVRISR
jgi:hypothetical protein